jgi:hypothetical protein
VGVVALVNGVLLLCASLLAGRYTRGAWQSLSSMFELAMLPNFLIAIFCFVGWLFIQGYEWIIG